jgi:hypothetical protein
VSVNKYLPHVYLFPEDDNIRQIANGFVKKVPDRNLNRIQIMPEGRYKGGWRNVWDVIHSVHIPILAANAHRHLVALIDFDNEPQRIDQFNELIPSEFRSRVFILGIHDESETLKSTLKITFEEIGMALATDCDRGTTEVWGHELLAVNSDELARLRQMVSPFLFDNGVG